MYIYTLYTEDQNTNFSRKMGHFEGNWDNVQVRIGVSFRLRVRIVVLMVRLGDVLCLWKPSQRQEHNDK